MFLKSHRAAAGPTQAGLAVIEVKDDRFNPFNVVGVQCSEELFGFNMADAGFHQALGLDVQSGTLFVFQRQPADVGLVAELLRHDIGHVLIIDRALV